MTTYKVEVDGTGKGVIERKHGRWVWHRPNRAGTDRYPKGHTLFDVRAHIGRVCRGLDVQTTRDWTDEALKETNR